MATTTVNNQIIQKVAADEYLLLHPETDAEVVILASESITATTVKAALEELKALISDIQSGSVTGVKGSAESSYRTGQVNITKANIGLGNVDNTSDANKPISSATQTALNKKVDNTVTVNGHALSANVTVTKSDVSLGNVTNDAQVKRSEMGVASGVATLDSSGKVPSSQLPSYVDDVLEYDAKSSFPTTGETGKIYVDKTTNLTYRWSGTAYVEISPSLALGETSSTAYAGDKGKQNATDIATLKTSVATAQSTADTAKTNAATAQSTADTAKTNAATAQSTADAAKSAAETNAAAIEDIVDGTTTVKKATSATSATSATKLATARKISITGDATGSTTFDGSADKSISVTLANSGVTAGTYSAVTVDAKGRATAGAQVVEVGSEGQTTPSSSLAVGGIFFKRI